MVREFIIGFVLSTGFAYLSQRLAPLVGLVDSPDDAHKQHSRTVAIGGWTLALSAIPLLALVGSAPTWRLMLSSLIVLVTGVLDDRVGLSPRTKLLGQLLCAVVTVLVTGWAIQSVNLLGMKLVLGWVAIPFTLFWIVGAINAFNLIDGLDGLATGGALIICSATALIAWQGGNNAVLTLSVGFVGVLLGFLLFNWAPARVFLGDGGTHFVGYWLAVLSIQATQSTVSTSPTDVPLIVSVFLLGVPIADTTWAIVRRLWRRKPIFQADRGHLHHRILALGWGERAAVLILYAIFAVSCGMAVVIFKK